MNKNNPQIAIVIVNWNRRELLLEAVASCFASDYAASRGGLAADRAVAVSRGGLAADRAVAVNPPRLTVIVVDNGSKDGSIEAVRDVFSDVILIENEHNLGFAKGSNQGLDEAVKIGADYILFLNNDAALDTAAVIKMVVLFEENPQIGAVAPFIFYFDKKDVIWYGGGIIAFWRGRIAHRFIRRRFIAEEHIHSQTDYITGCAFMGRTEAIKTLCGFDTSLGLYSEDVDLSLKLRRAGWELWVTPEAKAYHRVSASAGGELSQFKAFHRGRSNAMLVRRWAKLWELPTLVLGGLFGGIIISLKLMLKGKAGTVIALWQGIFNGLLGRRISKLYELS